MSDKKLFLLDAMALIYRAYYALIRNPRLTSSGKNTNAQFGFTNTLIELLNKEKPSHIAVAFDTQAPTDRHVEFEAYKANRQAAPEDLINAIPDIKKIIKGFNIPVIEYDGFEADDVIGALAKQAEKVGYTVFMVTPDKDYGQLVSDNIFIYKPPAFGNKAEIIGPKEVCEKWNIKSISQVIDILGLMGDASDNIPGIPGVGEKTAAKLLAEYGTLENVLDQSFMIKGSLGEKIRNGKELALMSKKLATIILDVPVHFHERNFEVSALNSDALNDIFTELEFKSLGKRILGNDFSVVNTVPSLPAPKAAHDLFSGQDEESLEQKTSQDIKVLDLFEDGLIAANNISNTPHEYFVANTIPELFQLLEVLSAYTEICIDTETTGLDANRAQLVGASFSVREHQAWYVPFPNSYEGCVERLAVLKPLFEQKNILWIGHNIKYDILILKRYGISLEGNLFDTMLAHYLVEPESRRNMDLLSVKYLNYQPVSIEDLIGKKGKNQIKMSEVSLEKIANYAAEDADVTLQLKNKFEPLVTQKEVSLICHSIENPLVKVLAQMEYEGVKIDSSFLSGYSKELEAQALEYQEKVYTQAGARFNLASPKQLGEILFEHLKLDSKAKKTKTGQYATGEEVLQKLANEHNIAHDILAFRELMKLKSTYVDAFPQLINPLTGRVHTSYNQAVVVTGRLSSNNPNLQNIPIRTALGREIRKAFITSSDDYMLLSADYSQIELRIVAAISGDENMCQAFRNKEDVHSATAAKVYGVALNEVTKEMRYKAKSVNFGLIYGQGVFGLAQNIGVTRTEAKQLIENYFKQYPAIKTYMDQQIIRAKEKGYVETILGRKRWLPDIHSANAVVRGFAERNAINMPIQGSAADMIKLAMIQIHNQIQKQKLKSKMLLQVHDELVFEVHLSELDLLKHIIIEEMQNAMPLPNNVPVEAEVGIGKNWLEAH